VLFLDDDANASPVLARAHFWRHADGGARVVQGPFPLLPAARRSFVSAGVGRWADALTRRLSTPGYRLHHTDVSFANTSMPRSLWESTGGFHEGFRRFGNEDYELAIRLLAAGVEMAFEPAAVAWQDYRKDFRTWCREWREVGRADLALWRLHPAVEPDLAFSRIASLHPVRRAALRGGLRGSRLAGSLVASLTWVLIVADRLGLQGRPLDLLKWIPADAWYGRGLRDALREGGAAPAVLAGAVTWEP